MNCYYHSDRDVVGMCVECGKPVCTECKVVLPDKKLYCNPCVINGPLSFYEKGLWVWWLLPTALGIIGGLIAYLFNKRKAPITSTDYLIVGLFTTIFIPMGGAILYS